MKILHTADWHVGKVLKGRDRYDEHAAVLASIVRTAREQDVDVVLIAGDLFETAAPSPRAQGLVMRTLLALRQDGRHVVAIAGNHTTSTSLTRCTGPCSANSACTCSARRNAPTPAGRCGCEAGPGKR